MNQANYATMATRVIEEHGIADEPLSRALREVLERGLSRARVPGAQAAVRRDGELLWSACAGWVSLPTQDVSELASESLHVERSDRFVIASVTKLVIATITMSLVEQGELDLDSAIDRWLPEIPNSQRITLRMLLSHGSGLQEYFKDQWLREQLEEHPLRNWSRQEVIDAIARLGPETGPGERFAYRNSNYLLIGEILEICTGKSIGALLAEHVSNPLGLDTLSFYEEHPTGSRLAVPYTWRLWSLGDPLTHTGGRLQSDAMGEVWTDGGIAASAEDLSAFTDALFSGRLLREETVEQMSTPPGYGESLFTRILRMTVPGAKDAGYGLGIMVEKREDSQLLAHNGMYLGWSAIITFDTRSRVTVSVLTNLSGSSVPAGRLEKGLRAALAR